MFIVPNIFAGCPVVAAQSTRLGGLSQTPYASLNLGLSVGDDEKTVLANRVLFCEGLGASASQLAYGRQVHGNGIACVQAPGYVGEHDALITAVPGVYVTVFAADCTPILLYDRANHICAAVHAGWRGTAGRILYKTIQRMQQEFGTQAANCLAYIGTCIGPDAFEVDADVADHFGPAEKRYDALKQKFFVDLKQANRQQLLDSGVPGHHIEVSPYCTVLNNDMFFSHRHEKGLTGRMMATIGLAGRG